MSNLSRLALSEKFSLDILKLQDENGCWNVLNPGDKYYPDFQYYCPSYTSTLWTMIFLADIKCPKPFDTFDAPLKIMSEQLFDKENGIYAIGKSHFPIPCLNGNMLYLHSYFSFGKETVINGIIDFFSQYQRFDDGDYTTPSSHPYYRNRSCYGKHTCYWGVVKLLKGLSFLPKGRRTSNANKLISRCIDFILVHEVCYSSKQKEYLLQPQISKLTFPNLYKGDFLEILWLLKREGVQDSRMNRALELLKTKMQADGSWIPERKIGKLIIPFGSKKYGSAFITERAREVLDYYGK